MLAIVLDPMLEWYGDGLSFQDSRRQRQARYSTLGCARVIAPERQSVPVTFDLSTTNPEASSLYRRTPEEKADERLAWARPDRAVFAAGACHVLAYRFIERMPEAEFRAIHIHPRGVDLPYHMFATDGTIAFDFNGFSDDVVLRRVNAEAMRTQDSSWEAEFVVIEDDLETFCRLNNCRPPPMYPGDIIARADRYLDQFSVDRA
jgi:hypothetical protein